MRLSISAVIFLLLLAPALAALSPAEVARFAERFAVDDSLSQATAFRDFDMAVPPTERAGALVQLWDAPGVGQPAVRQGVLNYLVAPSRAAWNPALAQRLEAAARQADPEARRVAVNVWMTRPLSESRPVLLAALDDPVEDNRINALNAIRAWPDAANVLRDYAQHHQAQKERQGSVRQARALLDRISKEKKR